MNHKFMVRQPIKTLDYKIIGYEILYFGENEAFGDIDPNPVEPVNELESADSVYHFLKQNGHTLFSNSLNFMTFTPTLLMKEAPLLFSPDNLVIQMDDSVTIHPLAMQLIKKYSMQGYQIAVNEFQFQPRYVTLLNEINYIKLNMEMEPSSLRNIIEIAHSLHKKCIATRISNEALYHKALALQVDALEGSYVSEKLANVPHSGSYLQSNFFRLVVAVTKEEPDLQEIVDLISVDATLSYALLRLSNTALFSTRNQVTTIHQAIMTLGLRQLKQWVYMLSTNNEGATFDPNSEEFLKLSFMRANFCSELMQYAKDMPISKSDAYLMGMFSTLHHLIDAPLEDILSEIPLPASVKAALLAHEGRVGRLYELILSYERADWGAIPRLAEELGIPSKVLTSLYFSCMEDVNLIWQQLSSNQDTPTIASR